MLYWYISLSCYLHKAKVWVVKRRESSSSHTMGHPNGCSMVTETRCLRMQLSHAHPEHTDQRVIYQCHLKRRIDSASASMSLYTSVAEHPSYNSPSADTVALTSSDEMQFHVHSEYLVLGSGFFRDLLSIPPAQEQQGTTTSTTARPVSPPSLARSSIPLSEDAELVCTLLDSIYPNFGVKYDAFSKVVLRRPEELVRMAEKYEVTGLIELCRTTLFPTVPNNTSLDATSFPSQVDEMLLYPLHRYCLACTFGWDAEAKQVSAETLSIDLNSAPALAILSTLPSPSSLLSLQALHRKRKLLILEALTMRSDMELSVDQSIRWHHVNLYGARCVTPPMLYRDQRWRSFVLFVSEEMERSPNGGLLRDAGVWFAGRESYINDIFDIRHGENGCGMCIGEPLLNRERFFGEIERVLDSLPKNISEHKRHGSDG